MWILWIALFGLIIGLIARWIVPGEAPGGVIADIVVGVVGALLGSWLYRLLGVATGLSLPSFICALIGAIVLLWALRALRGRPAV